jgi:hypothetical protein
MRLSVQGYVLSVGAGNAHESPSHPGAGQIGNGMGWKSLGSLPHLTKDLTN